MPDPSYVIETGGREQGLAFHLDTAFYPPLPGEVKTAFIETFKKYWAGEIEYVDDLRSELELNAGYKGDIYDYNFWMFLNEEDLYE